eukprot:15485-Heterococcus_DN1.PRE.1
MYCKAQSVHTGAHHHKDGHTDGQFAHSCYVLSVAMEQLASAMEQAQQHSSSLADKSFVL